MLVIDLMSLGRLLGSTRTSKIKKMMSFIFYVTSGMSEQIVSMSCRIFMMLEPCLMGPSVKKEDRWENSGESTTYLILADESLL